MCAVCVCVCVLTVFKTIFKNYLVCCVLCADRRIRLKHQNNQEMILLCIFTSFISIYTINYMYKIQNYNNLNIYMTKSISGCFTSKSAGVGFGWARVGFERARVD